MAYIFLDESGQFVKHNDEKYFVIAAFIVGDPRRTEKKFRAWTRSKRFPKRMRTQSELKWSMKGIPHQIRLKTLNEISRWDIRIRYVYLQRRNIPDSYRYHGKIKSGILYTNVVGELLESFFPIADKELRIFCDRRHLKGLSTGQFNASLKARLLPKMSHDTNIQIEMIDSTTNANIQIVDWIVGSLAYYLEGRDLGKHYISLLKNNILGSRELFDGEFLASSLESKKTC